MATCEKCGDITDCPKCGEPLKAGADHATEERLETHTKSAALKVEALHDWRNAVKPETAAKIDQQTFKAIKGDGFRTLFVSAIARVNCLFTEADLADKVREVFAADIAPVLDAVNENCEVLGHLAVPSTIKLAVTDLSLPAAAFCFVTVKDTPELEAKLNILGLHAIYAGEGMVATVGASAPHRTIFVK